ncbi:hypothetical protein DPMN_142853 [Dreissena polymorpha]|uniref:Uncharacterized protein n=1 Tax=Dreissena polymorpha TaxID=45954 RepID=A0A9D4JNU1_DREPO|nr:hypothetical protein DPMN_142853 [Dreissena polymorpha]
MYPTNLRQPFNLSTIMEVETPSSSARPSDGHSSDPNDLSQYSMQSQKSKRSLDYSQSKSSERIPEEPDMENVHTQMEALRKGWDFCMPPDQMCRFLKKLGLMHVRKVSSQISLCSLHRLIRDDSFRLNLIVGKDGHP